MHPLAWLKGHRMENLAQGLCASENSDRSCDPSPCFGNPQFYRISMKSNTTASSVSATRNGVRQGSWQSVFNSSNDTATYEWYQWVSLPPVTEVLPGCSHQSQRLKSKHIETTKDLVPGPFLCLKSSGTNLGLTCCTEYFIDQIFLYLWATTAETQV